MGVPGAWLMIAGSGHGRRGCDLTGLIAGADASNHDIPTEDVLGAASVASSSRGYDGLRPAQQAKGGMFERAPSLLRLLEGRPLREADWDLPPGAWQAAYDRYRSTTAGPVRGARRRSRRRP